MRKVVIKCKNVLVFNFFRSFFLKCTFFLLQHFFLPSTCSVNSFFQWLFESIWFMFLKKHFFPLCNRCYFDWKYAFFLLAWQPLLKKQFLRHNNAAYQFKLSLTKLQSDILLKQNYCKGVSSTSSRKTETFKMNEVKMQ